MPIHHDVEQGSEEWNGLRLGIPTSSEFKKLITPKEHRESSQWKDYAYHLLAERILMRPEDHYTSPAMERGKNVQDQAADWYEMRYDRDTTKIGFVSSDDFYTDSRGYKWFRFGCSPDRFVGDSGILEIKCPTPRVQLKCWFEDKPDLSYIPQLQGQLLVTDREWADILFWHEEMPKVVIRVERDETLIGVFKSILVRFNDFMDGVMDKLGPLQPAAPKRELKEQLKEQLRDTLMTVPTEYRDPP
jgi:exodeoxyribonuclease (lambda-induced)